jgi:hypothetical protein
MYSAVRKANIDNVCQAKTCTLKNKLEYIFSKIL